MHAVLDGRRDLLPAVETEVQATRDHCQYTGDLDSWSTDAAGRQRVKVKVKVRVNRRVRDGRMTNGLRTHHEGRRLSDDPARVARDDGEGYFALKVVYYVTALDRVVKRDVWLDPTGQATKRKARGGEEQACVLRFT